jgi:nitrate/nitrite-specific signal transduction histidine kinase
MARPRASKADRAPARHALFDSSSLAGFLRESSGVLVLSQDITSMTALLERAGGAAAMAVIAILAGVLLVVFLTVRIVVLKPLAHLTHAALAIRNGQLDATI